MDEMTERTTQASDPRDPTVKGYKILDRLPLDGTQVFVAEDAEHDALAFVQCMPTKTADEDFAEPEMASRSSLEHLALAGLPTTSARTARLSASTPARCWSSASTGRCSGTTGERSTLACEHPPYVASCREERFSALPLFALSPRACARMCGGVRLSRCSD